MHNYPYNLHSIRFNATSVEGGGSAADDDSIDVSDIAAAASVAGEIPPAFYMARLIKAELKNSGSSGLPQLVFDAEIVSPESAPSFLQQGTTVPTAGKKFNFYVALDRKAGNFASSVNMLARLSLLDGGKIKPSLIIQAANSGRIFFRVRLGSEETFHRLPKRPGQKEGDLMLIDGKPVSRGFRPALPNAEDVTGQCPPPEGWVPPMF